MAKKYIVKANFHNAECKAKTDAKIMMKNGEPFFWERGSVYDGKLAAQLIKEGLVMEEGSGDAPQAEASAISGALKVPSDVPADDFGEMPVADSGDGTEPADDAPASEDEEPAEAPASKKTKGKRG